MISNIIQNEWLQWRRNSQIKWLVGFLIIISLIALLHQLNYQSNLLNTRLKAQEDSRKEWLGQELKHPHMAAHFGNYAYKKPTSLQCLDPGLSIYTGTSVYMEPHRQNDFLFSKSQESDTGLRFGWLSPALICQLILPLFIILFTFNSVNGEFEKGTIQLLLAQGASFRKILFSKVLATFILFESFIIPYFLLTTILSWKLFGGDFSLVSLLYLLTVYSIYCLIWCLLGVLVSAHIKKIGVSIAVLLLVWMFTNIIMPRMSANLAENIYPLITNYDFKKQIKESIEKGLDGHDPNSDRALKIEKDLLVKYKVDSVQQLPFNFEGYIMQQSEEYSSKAYDVHFKKIFATLINQKKVQTWMGVTSPYILIRNLSMTACNAGLESEIDFQTQAENYRRSFVQNMNNDMKDNSAYNSFDTYRVKKGKYEAITDLQIENRSLTWLLQSVFIENIWLLFWGFSLFILMFRSRINKFYS
jgi:ABC-2 type transport system permease protein